MDILTPTQLQGADSLTGDPRPIMIVSATGEVYTLLTVTARTPPTKSELVASPFQAQGKDSVTGLARTLLIDHATGALLVAV